MKGRTIIIGIDGVPFHLMQSLADTDVMPTYKTLLQNGCHRKMQSSVPAVSSVSWSSIITGTNPGMHNIYGFTELIPGTYTLSFPNYRSMRQQPFWMNDSGMYFIVNVPMTYPVAPVRGCIVSGFVSLDIARAAYPSSFADMLTKMNYEIDVDSTLVYTSESLFYKKLYDVHMKRIDLFHEIWKRKWDTFMFVFTGSDRLGHFYWDASYDKYHKYRESFLQYYRMIDTVLEKIVSEMHEDDTLLMLSDHGMAQINQDVYLNTFLQEQGLLKIETGGKSYRDITGGKIFSLDPGRFYVNKKGKYPQGTVTDTIPVVDETYELLKNLRWEGQRVIQRLYRRDEIYHGPFVENAPDLVAIPYNGFSLHGGIGKQEVFTPCGRINGMHTFDDAFLYVYGKEHEKTIPIHPRVEDVVGIMEMVRQQ